MTDGDQPGVIFTRSLAALFDITPRLRARFAARTSVASDDPNACWLWKGRIASVTGYGVYNHVLAHRLSYYLATGNDPHGYVVCHHCDNPPCVNPAHLFLGTPADNAIDASEKGLLSSGHGPRPRKITADHIAIIRASLVAGISRRAVARCLDVDPALIRYYERKMSHDQ